MHRVPTTFAPLFVSQESRCYYQDPSQAQGDNRDKPLLLKRVL